ncbi:hypothetical protein [Consotaella salsifontis]|uniref:Surface antigen n=1 Tax=Consotaella salsifontis TaxID=1365950 RepID=A0A1T4MCN8_9HYPH|nr:hypothetical protein [Consotaella salsifontis]SJZ64627.1 Surface antigen [Consotaella salsifontis]
MRRFFNAAAPALLALALGGCLTQGGVTSPFAEGAKDLGAGLVGQIKGVRLSGEARDNALLAEFQALQFAPAGEAVAWKAGSVQGQVVPTQLYRIGTQDCRGYKQTVVNRSGTFEQTGTACRTERGTWQVVV